MVDVGININYALRYGDEFVVVFVLRFFGVRVFFGVFVNVC